MWVFYKRRARVHTGDSYTLSLEPVCCPRSGLLTAFDLHALRGILQRHRALVRSVCEVGVDPGRRGCWSRCDTCGAFNHVGPFATDARCVGCTGAVPVPVAISPYVATA